MARLTVEFLKSDCVALPVRHFASGVAFLKFSERVRSPTVSEGNTRDRPLPQHHRSQPILFSRRVPAGVALPADGLLTPSKPGSRLLRRNLLCSAREIDLKARRDAIQRLAVDAKYLGRPLSVAAGRL